MQSGAGVESLSNLSVREKVSTCRQWLLSCGFVGNNAFGIDPPAVASLAHKHFDYAKIPQRAEFCR